MNIASTVARRLCAVPSSSAAAFQKVRTAGMGTVSPSGVWKQTRELGRGINVHRSNRAKAGLYHGKDIMFGSNISKKNETHTKRRWYPNVQNKRVYSEALDNWVRFRMTTAALRAIDHAGGIDTYLLQLDNRLVDDSNYVTKIRRLIGSTLYHRGELDAHTIKKLNYHRDPPAKLDISFDDKLKKYIENEILEGAEESEPLQ